MGILVGLIIIAAGIWTNNGIVILIALIVGGWMIKKSYEDDGLIQFFGILLMAAGVIVWDISFKVALVLLISGGLMSGAVAALFDIISSFGDKIEFNGETFKKVGKVAYFVIPVLFKVGNGATVSDAVIEQLHQFF